MASVQIFLNYFGTLDCTWHEHKSKSSDIIVKKPWVTWSKEENLRYFTLLLPYFSTYIKDWLGPKAEADLYVSVEYNFNN